MSDTIEALKAELEAVKKELTTQKTAATKAAKKVEELKAELHEVKKDSPSNEVVKSLQDENAVLKQEIENISKVLEETKGIAQRSKNKQLQDSELKERALRVMKQENIQECFITLNKGYVFMKEALAVNAGKGNYKVALLADDKVILKNPK